MIFDCKYIVNYDDCKYIVNYDECVLYHCECNGCMECSDYESEESGDTQ